MKFLMIAMLMIASVFTTQTVQANGFGKEHFSHVIYLDHAGVAANSGLSKAAPKPFVSGNLWAIPAGVVIEKVYVIVDTAITGTTVMNLGDANGTTSFCPTASITLGTPGMYCWDAKAAGAYLRIQTAGVSDAADIYVVPSAKYYSAAGLYVAAAFTTTNTAGAARVVIEGYNATLN